MERIRCPGCNTEMIKGSHQHKFCKDKIIGRSNCRDFVCNWKAESPELFTEPTFEGCKPMKVEVKLELKLIKQWLDDGTVTLTQINPLTKRVKHEFFNW